MPILVLHTAILLTSVFLTFIWTRIPSLSSYSLQAIGIMILSYFAARHFLKKSQRFILVTDAAIFISLTLLLVLSTGGQHSPIFFLLYLLLFAISLIFEPIQAILLAFSLLTVFFVDSISTNFDSISIINLATLIIIAPLGFIFGKKYLESLENLGRIQILRQIISEEETDSLLWITTKANPTLISVIDAMGDTLIHLNTVKARVSIEQLSERLRQIQHDLVTLHRTANELKQGITDQNTEDK